MESQLENNLAIIDTLNDLIQINNDRIQGSEKAIETINDVKYKRLFERVIEQSAEFRQQLISEVRRIGGQAEWNGTTNKGKIYGLWLDIKSAFKLSRMIQEGSKWRNFPRVLREKLMMMYCYLCWMSQWKPGNCLNLNGKK